MFTSLYPDMSIVTLTFNLWPPKSIGFILSLWLTFLPSLTKNEQRCSLYHVHKVHARADERMDGTTQGRNHSSVTISHRRELRGDKKRLLLRCIHHLKSDSINNMDPMRISGAEPSSVILSKTKQFQKLECVYQKCLNSVLTS